MRVCGDHLLYGRYPGTAREGSKGAVVSWYGYETSFVKPCVYINFVQVGQYAYFAGGKGDGQFMRRNANKSIIVTSIIVTIIFIIITANTQTTAVSTTTLPFITLKPQLPIYLPPPFSSPPHRRYSTLHSSRACQWRRRIRFQLSSVTSRTFFVPQENMNFVPQVLATSCAIRQLDQPSKQPLCRKLSVYFERKSHFALSHLYFLLLHLHALSLVPAHTTNILPNLFYRSQHHRLEHRPTLFFLAAA